MKSILSELINAEIEEKAKILAAREDILKDVREKLRNFIQYIYVNDMSDVEEIMYKKLDSVRKEYRSYRDKLEDKLYRLEETIAKRYDIYKSDVERVCRAVEDIYYLQHLMKKSDAGYIQINTDLLKKYDVYLYYEKVCDGAGCRYYTTENQIRKLITYLAEKHNITDKMLNDKDIDKYIELQHSINESYSDEEEDARKKISFEMQQIVENEERREVRDAVESSIKLIDKILNETDSDKRVEMCKELIILINNYKLYEVEEVRE